MDDWYSSTRKIPNVCCCPSSMIPFFLSVLLEQRSRERNGRDGLGWTLLQEGKRKTRPTRTNLFLTSRLWRLIASMPGSDQSHRRLGQGSGLLASSRKKEKEMTLETYFPVTHDPMFLPLFFLGEKGGRNYSIMRKK